MKLASPGHYRIFSVKGSTQLGGSYVSGEPIDVEQLAPGNYFLHLQLENGVVRIGQFIKGR